MPETGTSGAAVHYRALEALYASAPVNRLFDSRLEILGEGHARIRFTVDERVHHAAGAAHGTIYFKMLDDAAFYAANTLVSDRFLLTTAFNLHFTAPIRSGSSPSCSSRRGVRSSAAGSATARSASATTPP